MLTLTSPATLPDLAACFDGGVRWDFARRQVECGPSYAVVDEAGETVAVGGFVPSGRGAEAWFAPAPAAAARMVGLVRLMRLTLQAAPYRPIVAVLLTAAGRRIARAIGLEKTP